MSREPTRTSTHELGGTMAETSKNDLMTPAEVAALFRVDPKTVTRWADAGKIQAVRTLGGHRRYLRSEVERLLVGRTDAPESN